MDDKVEQAGTNSMQPEDPEASLYSCPNCGLELPAVDFLTHDGQSYNPYCSACMAGYAQVMALQHQHHETASVDPLIETEHHSQLNVHQLLAAQVVGPSHVTGAEGGALMGNHDASVAGHSAQGQLLLSSRDMPDPNSASIASYHDVHAAVLGYAMAPTASMPHVDAAMHHGETKKCSKCKMHKPDEDFPPLKAKHRGRAAHCYSCRRAAIPSQRDGADSLSMPDVSHDPLVIHLQQASNRSTTYLPLVAEKRCCQCGLVKPASGFRRTRNKTDHLQSRCKDCEEALGRGTKKRNTKESFPVVRVTRKMCGRCGQDKAAVDFFVSKTSLDGLYSYCKPCHRELNKASRDRKSEDTTRTPSAKLCKLCKQYKTQDQFYKGKMNQDGLYSYCKGCATKIDTQRKKEYRQRKRLQRADGARDGADDCKAGSSALPKAAHAAFAVNASGGHAVSTELGFGGAPLDIQHADHQQQDGGRGDAHDVAQGQIAAAAAAAPLFGGYTSQVSHEYVLQYQQHEQYQYRDDENADEAGDAGFDPSSVSVDALQYDQVGQAPYYQQLYEVAQHNARGPGVQQYIVDGSGVYLDGVAAGGGGSSSMCLGAAGGSQVFEQQELGGQCTGTGDGRGHQKSEMHIPKRLRSDGTPKPLKKVVMRRDGTLKP